MKFMPHAVAGESEIFVPQERHYPDGFQVLYKGLVLSCNPLAPGFLKVLENPNKLDTSVFNWDVVRQRLIVRQWDSSVEPVTLEVVPGFRN